MPGIPRQIPLRIRDLLVTAAMAGAGCLLIAWVATLVVRRVQADPERREEATLTAAKTALAYYNSLAELQVALGKAHAIFERTDTLDLTPEIAREGTHAIGPVAQLQSEANRQGEELDETMKRMLRRLDPQYSSPEMARLRLRWDTLAEALAQGHRGLADDANDLRYSAYGNLDFATGKRLEHSSASDLLGEVAGMEHLCKFLRGQAARARRMIAEGRRTASPKAAR